MRRGARLILATLTLILVAGVSPTRAQESKAGTGTLEGLITDSEKAPLPAATVEVKSASAGITKTALTGTDGRYKLANLPPATDYVLLVSYSGGGFAPVTQDRIVIRADRITVESVSLFPEIVEEVQVLGKGEAGERVVQLEDIGQKTTFSSEFVDSLPLIGRNYQDILTLAAGVVDPDNDGNPNVLGARAENFQAVIDGVSNQDPLGGTFLSNLNTDAIEATEVIQSGADASFSRASGGFANIITKSGSNQFEGTFTLSFRSSLFDDNGQTGNPVTDFKSIRPALILSGPLVKDKLWYFFSDEEINDDIPVNTLAGIGTLIRELTGRRFLGKLTWQINSSNKMTAQVRSDPYEFTNLGINSFTLPEAGYTQIQGGPFYQASLDTVFSPSLLLTSRVAYTDSGIDIVPNNPQDPNDHRLFLAPAYVIDLDRGAVTGSFFQRSTDQRQRLTWREDLTHFVEDFFGRHDLIVGLRYEREKYSAEIFRGTVRTQNLAARTFGGGISSGLPRFDVTEEFGIPERQGGRAINEGTSDIYGMYISDTWLPLPNLSITAGLRFDREQVAAPAFTPFDPRDELNTFQRFLQDCTALFDSGIPIGQAVNDLLAQRLPGLYAAYAARYPGQYGSNIPNCGAARAFFFTFPKKSFVEDCITLDTRAFCTPTLNDASYVYNVKGGVVPSTFDVTNSNLAPRFQISWDPWNNGKTKFFATWGRFYDRVNLAAATIEQGPDLRSRRFQFISGINAALTDDSAASDQSATVVDRNIKTEFNDEWTIGFEREIAPETKIRLTYVSRHFRNQLQDVDLNHYPRDVGVEYSHPVRRNVDGVPVTVGFVPVGGDSLCPFDPVVGGRQPDNPLPPPPGIVYNGELAQPNGVADDCFGQFVTALNGQTFSAPDGVPDLFRRNFLYNNILFLSNRNFSTYEGVTVEFTKRLQRNWQLQASWTHSKSLGAADNFLDESGTDPSLVDDEFGPTGFDIRDVVRVSATTILPWDITLGTIMSYLSGTPYSLRELKPSFDSFDESTLRTVFPTGRRNDQRNEPYFKIDVNAEKAFLIKKYNATAQLVIENLLGDDYLIVDNFRNDRRLATRDFGRRYEARFKVNF